VPEGSGCKWCNVGLNINTEKPTPAMLAELHALEGRGLTLFGDTRGARQAVLSA